MSALPETHFARSRRGNEAQPHFPFCMLPAVLFRAFSRGQLLFSRSLAAACAALVLAGCAHFEPKPISPAQTAAALESRSLTNSALKTFLEKNLHRDLTNWPAASWDFDLLTLAAFYYHPDLAVARAQWNVAQAGIQTAGGRPNPTLSLVPGYDTTHNAGLSPWFPAVSFDVPIETAGKRGRRIATAEQLSESARLNIATVAWQIRSNLRKSLLDSTGAHQRAMLLQAQVSIQERIAELLAQQAEAGAIAKSDLATRRVALQKARLDLADAASQRVEARARVAEAVGIPLKALDGVELAFQPLKDFSPPGDLTSAEVRRAALTSRADILGALADYAAAQATLQLEIAKQYPDVHLNPGYQYDQGDNKWSLGLSVELPVFNQNQGPIAQSRARRKLAAAKFLQLQSQVIAQVERAVAGWQSAQSLLKTSGELLDSAQRQQESINVGSNLRALEISLTTHVELDNSDSIDYT